MSRVVAFDFDGTLVRSNRIKRACFYEAVAAVPGAADVLDALFAADFEGDRYALLDAVVARLSARGATGLPDAAALAESYGRACRARIAAAPEVPGAGEALARLKAAGARLFLISATPQGPLDAVVADRGLTAFFERVLGGPTDKPTHLRAILADCGIGPAEITLVGDGRDDLAAARAVGCRFIAVNDQPKAPLGPGVPGVPDLTDLPRRLGVPPVAVAGGTG